MICSIIFHCSSSTLTRPLKSPAVKGSFPPSSWITAPFNQLEKSLVMYKAKFATSSTSPMRPKGIWSLSTERNCPVGSKRLKAPSVSKGPGDRQLNCKWWWTLFYFVNKKNGCKLTRIPYLPHSAAKDLLMASTPAF